MPELHTDKGLLRALEKASTRSQTFEQSEAQRLSFVMGSLPKGNAMTKAEVKDALDRHEGRTKKHG